MNKPEHEKRFEEALDSVDPARSLYDLAQALCDEGVSQIDLYFLFEKYHLELSGDDPRYDAVVDPMDYIVGWCPPGRGYYSTDLTSDLIEAARRERRNQ